MDSEKLLGVEATLAEVMLFLDGMGPLDGCWFGEQPAGMKRFWWRAHLRQAFARFERDLATTDLREALAAAALSELPKERWSCSDDASGTALTLARQRKWSHDAVLSDLQHNTGEKDGLPDDVRALIVAARRFWDDNEDCSGESRALDQALEAFASSVPYDGETG